MSEMTPQQAADWIEKYEERSAEQRGGFGSLLFGGGPWGRAIRVLIDHARAAAPARRDQGYVALADQWRLDADNLRNAALPKAALLTIAEHLDQAATIVGGERP